MVNVSVIVNYKLIATSNIMFTCLFVFFNSYFNDNFKFCRAEDEETDYAELKKALASKKEKSVKPGKISTEAEKEESEEDSDDDE